MGRKAKAEAMTALNVRIPTAEYEETASMAEVDGLTLSALVRHLLTAYREAKKAPAEPPVPTVSQPELPSPSSAEPSPAHKNKPSGKTFTTIDAKDKSNQWDEREMSEPSAIESRVDSIFRKRNTVRSAIGRDAAG